MYVCSINLIQFVSSPDFLFKEKRGVSIERAKVGGPFVIWLGVFFYPGSYLLSYLLFVQFSSPDLRPFVVDLSN